MSAIHSPKVALWSPIKLIRLVDEALAAGAPNKEKALCQVAANIGVGESKLKQHYYKALKHKRISLNIDEPKYKEEWEPEYMR